MNQILKMAVALAALAGSSAYAQGSFKDSQAANKQAVSVAPVEKVKSDLIVADASKMKKSMRHARHETKLGTNVKKK
jgi:hypothetical protein